jgi:hypothetical protein
MEALYVLLVTFLVFIICRTGACKIRYPECVYLKLYQC